MPSISRVLSTVAMALLPLSAAVPQVRAAAQPAPIVFFDIAGPDAARQSAFYDKVFGWKAGAVGLLSVPVSGPRLDGALRSDPTQKIIYIGVPDVAASLQSVVANGGKIVRARFEVKGVVALGLFTDPAGNAMGLVELGADGKPKIP